MPARPTRSIPVLLLATLACTGTGPGGDSAPTGPPAPGDPAAPVAGTQLYTFHATDSLTGGMVDGATMLAGTSAGVTDGGGRVSFRLRPGPLRIHAAHPDYATYSALVTLPHAGGLVAVRLQPLAPAILGCRHHSDSVAARVMDSQGRKTILRVVESYVVLEDAAGGIEEVPGASWRWLPRDEYVYEVRVPSGARLPVVLATWQVYDRDFHVRLDTCRLNPDGTEAPL